MKRNRYWTSLSARQKIGFAGVIVAAIVIVIAGQLILPGEQTAHAASVDVSMTIKQIATALKVTGMALARELELPASVARNKPLAKLGVTDAQLHNAVVHVSSHRPAAIKYFVFVGIVLFGLAYMTWLGRPAHTRDADHRVHYPRWPYVTCLALAVLVCGFLLGKSPNPMEGTVKVLKAAAGLYPAITPYAMAFLFFIALALVGNKLVCGWACPFGALQELTYSLPLFGRVKQRSLPFWLTNSIRCVLFLSMLLLLYGIVGGNKGYVLYHVLNPFNLFDWRFEHWLILTTTIGMLVLSFAIYRPFCYLICPFGLLSWLVERFSLTRVRVDRYSCNSCGACTRACPSEAARGIINRHLLPADCFACARCLNVCPSDSLRFGRRTLTRQSPPSPVPVTEATLPPTAASPAPGQDREASLDA